MYKKILYIALLILLTGDTVFSFLQHYSMSLDGDMASEIVPSEDMKPVFENPFGFRVFTDGISYPNPNRFFGQWTYKEYFTSVPIFLQKFVGPIDSIYLSCAIFKTIIQLLLIFLIALAITGRKNIFNLNFIIAAALITPLFQTYGYSGYMGIIDRSITYSFFYAFPITLLLLYFTPLIKQYYHKTDIKLPWYIKIFWIPFAFVICLSGPLNSGVILILSGLILFVNLKSSINLSEKNGIILKVFDSIKRVPGKYWFYLTPVCLISVYSLYIGRFNSFNFRDHVSIGELYSRLPEGIYYQFTQKLGFPVLFVVLIINSLLIHYKFRNTEGNKILYIFKWIGIFSLIYILLLPLGGYREYRPNILRYDTIMPITLCLVFVFGLSSLFLIKNLLIKSKMWYIPFIALILFVYTNSDKGNFSNNDCERKALQEISMSRDNVIILNSDCTVLSWKKITKPEDSDINAQLLNIWGVTKEKKLYYCK
ncbi:MAG: hypothetical protein ABIJ97_08315 [Bacteroidota bacterium]